MKSKRDGVKDAQELFELDQMYMDLRNAAQDFAVNNEKYRNAFDKEWANLMNKFMDQQAAAVMGKTVEAKPAKSKFTRGVVIGIVAGIVIHETGIDTKVVNKIKQTKRQFVLWSQS